MSYEYPAIEYRHYRHYHTDNFIVGTCGLCGGLVTAPRVWWGVGRIPHTCESCGAEVNYAKIYPVLPMKRTTTNNKLPGNNFAQTLLEKFNY